jgi:hypothetical protein
MHTYKIRFHSQDGTSEEFVVAANEKKAIKAFTVKHPSIPKEEIIDVSLSSKEESARAPKSSSGSPKSRASARQISQKSNRSGTGRGVASILGFIGWIAVGVAVIFFFASFSAENPSMGYFIAMGGIIGGYLGGGLVMVGIAHVMSAIFDIADNSFERLQ